MTESTTIDRSAFVGTAMSLHTAGFKPEGSYLVEVLGAKPEVSSGTNQSTGESFVSHKINFVLRAHKQADYAADGTGKGQYVGDSTLDPTLTFYKRINIATKSLQFLRSAYKAVTGTLPTTSRPDYLAMAEELRGAKFWIYNFWMQNEEGEWSEQIRNNVRSQQEGPLQSIVLRAEEVGGDED